MRIRLEIASNQTLSVEVDPEDWAGDDPVIELESPHMAATFGMLDGLEYRINPTDAEALLAKMREIESSQSD